MNVPLRVLHVDDNPIDARLSQAFLAVSGIECDVVRVDTVPALEEALHQGEFDLILSDSVFPAFDGLHAFALVQHVCPGVPFIVLSGMLSDKAARRILICGAKAYVPKLRLSDVLHSIRRVLSDGHLPTHQLA
ncbi:MAG: response regulator [Nitrospirota bacterium]|nr:response regulator [Nitrospirota bacterium]